MEHFKDARWPVELIDAFLWEIAVHGGQVRAGYNSLVHALTQNAGETGMPDVPAERTVREWVQFRYRNRYAELLKQKAEELDEQRAQDASTLALQIREAEERALTQTLAGIGQANGVEASMILRNLATAKKLNSDVIVAARGMPVLKQAGEDLMSIARSLTRMGGVHIVDATGAELTEAQVVEEAERSE